MTEGSKRVARLGEAIDEFLLKVSMEESENDIIFIESIRKTLKEANLDYSIKQSINKIHSRFLSCLEWFEKEQDKVAQHSLLVEMARLVPEVYSILIKNLFNSKSDPDTIEWLDTMIDDIKYVFDKYSYFRTRLIMPEQLERIFKWRETRIPISFFD